jgi:TRAP-type C4-dicarboxylate transport system permease small subunit
VPATRGRRDQCGEGLISVAIAVLVLAFLALLVWGGMKLTLEGSETRRDAPYVTRP